MLLVLIVMALTLAEILKIWEADISICHRVSLAVAERDLADMMLTLLSILPHITLAFRP